MNTLRCLLSAIFVICVLPSKVSANHENAITLVVPIGALNSFNRVLSGSLSFKNGDDYHFPVEKCIPLADVKNYKLRRAAIELLIHCETIRRYKIADTIIILQAPNNVRAIKMVSSGLADALGVANFLKTFKRIGTENLLISDPVLREGEFEEGIFTAPNRQDVLDIKDINKLMDLTGVSVRQWNIDTNIINKLTPNAHMLVSSYTFIPQVIAKKRADITLSELGKKQIFDASGTVILQRVDGFKVSLPGVRSFVVNSKNQSYFQALQQYIQDNRSNDKINQDRIYNAYKDIDWIPTKYANWIRANDFFKDE